MGRSTSGRGSIGVRASVEMTAFSEQRHERCRDLGWLEPRTRTASGCQRLHGTVIVRTWVDRHWGVVWSGDSVVRLALGRRLRAGEFWSSTASICHSGFVGNTRVEWRWDVGLAIGWIHGLSGRGFGGQRQRGSLSQSLIKRRL